MRQIGIVLLRHTIFSVLVSMPTSWSIYVTYFDIIVLISINHFNQFKMNLTDKDKLVLWLYMS